MSAQFSVSTFNPRTFAVPLAIVLLALAGCSTKPKAPESAGSASAQQPSTAPAPTPANLESTDAETTKQSTALALPKDFGRATGDWDQIVKRGFLRVLVVNNRSGFFYDKGRARGMIAEAMTEFENVINKKRKTGARKFIVVYLPTAVQIS